MRILYDDLIQGADSIVSSTPSALYPADNLKNKIIARRYQGYGNADIVTITFSEDKSLNCFFYALQNFSSFSVVLKDSGGSTLQTINVTDIPDPEDKIAGREYFSTVTGVRSMVLNMATASASVFLGILRAGLYYETVNFLNAYSLGLKDRSLFRKTDVGYSTNNHVTPLKYFQLTFREAFKDEADFINEKYIEYGKQPIFFDFTHNNSDYTAPLYANIEQPPDPGKTRNKFAYQLKIEESK